MLSRIFGFIRDILMASFFGTSAGLEAFIVAFKIPNLFRSVFAEGFSDSVATPLLSSYRKEKDKMLSIGQDLICVLTFLLLFFTLAGILTSRYLVAAVAPGFIADSYRFGLAVSFTRLTFFYLFLIGLASNLNALLYAYKKFFIPAFSPVFLNLSFIAGILIFANILGEGVLVYSALAGGVLQLLFSFFALRKRNFRLKFNLKESLANQQIIKMFKLFVGRLFSSIIYELSVIVDTIFSSLSFIVGQGALASIYYANRLIQFPFAVVILSLSRVVMVDLSVYAKEGKIGEFKKLLIFSFQNIIFFILPVSVVFLFISTPIIEIVFARGQFSLDALNLTSSALFFYSFGLFFFCGIKLMVNSFYALSDTKTPAKTAGLALLANILLSGILIFPLRIGGVALGSSLAAAFNFFLLYFFLRKKVGAVGFSKLRSYFLRVFLLSLVWGGVANRLWLLEASPYLKILVIGTAGLVLLGLGGYLLGIRQVRLFWLWILKKK